MSFRKLKDMDYVMLYAGDIPKREGYKVPGMVGLSKYRHDYQHIRHDITKPMPIRDCCIDVYQAEDVFEHIEYQKLRFTINEIYRVLKPGGYFRLSVPDYRCDCLNDRSVKDENGKIVFDPGGGGVYKWGRVLKGGHIWFPVYETVLALIESSPFGEYEFYHYYDESGNSVTKPIDYSKGYVLRTPDHDERVQNPYRAMSIIVDMYK